jgi:hypothetical protein
MFKFKPDQIIIGSLATATALLTSIPNSEALPLATIDSYRDTKLRSNQLTIDSGFRGENPCILGKVNPTKAIETIVGLCQDGNKIFQASTAFKLSDSVLIAPYLQYESNKSANQFAGIYTQIDFLRSGDTTCNVNGFGESGKNFGWRAGVACDFDPKK